jgi:hypothetical protein
MQAGVRPRRGALQRRRRREVERVHRQAVTAHPGPEIEPHEAVPAFGLASVPLQEGSRVRTPRVIVTAHPGLDVELLARTALPIVDFRGVTRGLEAGRLVAPGSSSPS